MRTGSYEPQKLRIDQHIFFSQLCNEGTCD